MARPRLLDSLMSLIRPARTSPMEPTGRSGTAAFGGYLATIERSPKLAGTERYRTYLESIVNTTIVAAGARYFGTLVGGAEWRVVPAVDGGAEGERLARWTEEVLHDMESPLHRVMQRAAMFKFWGFAIQEWTAKRRADGTIGFLDFQQRPQHTIEQWDLDLSGRLNGVGQRVPQDGALYYLPRGRLFYLVDDMFTDSPDGMGLLRHVTEAVNRRRTYERLEGIGFETDLRGVPVGMAPYAELEALLKAGDITKNKYDAALKPLRSFIQNHYRAPEATLGLILDSTTYRSTDEGNTPSGQRKWGLELLKAESTTQEEIHVAIERLDREIARVLGVEGLLLGSDSRGSHALAQDKTSAFYTMVNGTMADLGHGATRDMVGALWTLNGLDPRLRPTIRPESVHLRDPEQIARTLESLAKAALPFNDPATDEVRELLGLSPQPEVPELSPTQLQLIDAQAAARAPARAQGGRQDAAEGDADAKARTADEEDVTKAYLGTSHAILLRVPMAWGMGLLPGGGTVLPEDLHLTLAILEGEPTPERDQLVTSVVRQVAAECGPVVVEVTGSAYFTAPDVTVVLVGSPALDHLREEVLEGLDAVGVEVRRDHGFIPHITVSRGRVAVDVPPAVVVFPAITYALGGAQLTMPLVPKED